jgi:hypothetical protein
MTFTAKDIVVAPIARADADKLVKRVHYSGTVVNNSQLHLGVFLGGKLEGVMQFGPSTDKRKLQGLVTGTGWNEFIELNRMAFSEVLPRNSESRALGVAMRMLRKHYPFLKWVVSFADATQCGDGTIYRASGFVLTGLRKNKAIWVGPDGKKVARMTLEKGGHTAAKGGRASLTAADGYKPLPGFQLRYVYFLQPDCRAQLTVPELPFSAIADAGARMHRGVTLQ